MGYYIPYTSITKINQICNPVTMTRYSSILLLLLVSAFVLLGTLTVAQENHDPTLGDQPPKKEKKRTPNQPKNWNKIDLNEIEKEWEEGDDKTLLEHEFEVNRRILAKKQPKFDMNDGASIQKAYKSDPFAFSSGGGMMVFVDLKGKQPNGKDWTSADVDTLAKKYASLLRTGSLPTTIYNIGDNRLLVNTEKTWQTKEILLFIARQEEVAQFTANSKTYKTREYLKEFDPEFDPDADDDEL